MGKFKFTEEPIANIKIENLTLIQVFSITLGLEGLLLLLKTESKRYDDQNGRMFQTTSEELYAFLGKKHIDGN